MTNSATSKFSKDLHSYIKISNIIPKHMCNVTVQELEQKHLMFNQHKFLNSKTGISEALSGNKELSYCNVETSTKKDKALSAVFKMLKQNLSLESTNLNLKNNETLKIIDYNSKLFNKESLLILKIY